MGGTWDQYLEWAIDSWFKAIGVEPIDRIEVYPCQPPMSEEELAASDMAYEGCPWPSPEEDR